jgi:hypothetical protein
MYGGHIGITWFFLGVGCTDAGRMTTQLGTPRERYDEYSSKFSLSKKPRFVSPGKNQTPEGDACKLSDTPTRAPLTILVSVSSTSSNAEPAHNTTKYFVPNLR